MARTRTLLLSLALAAGAFAAARPLLQEQMPQATEHHKHLVAMAGEWEGTITMFMPDAEPMVSPARETVRPVGELWTVSDFSSDMMGMAFHGHGTNGYDPERKKYVGTWIDSTSTYLTVMEGEYDSSRHVMVWRWKAPNYMGQGELIDFRMESTARADAYVTAFFMGDSKEKHMEIKMKRKAAGDADADKK